MQNFSNLILLSRSYVILERYEVSAKPLSMKQMILIQKMPSKSRLEKVTTCYQPICLSL